MNHHTDIETISKPRTRVQISQPGEETTIVQLTDEQLHLLNQLTEARGDGLAPSGELFSLGAYVPFRIVARPDPVQPAEPGAPVRMKQHFVLLPGVSFQRLPDLPEVEPEPKIDVGAEWRITGPDGAAASVRTFGMATDVLAALVAMGKEALLTGPESEPLEVALVEVESEFGVKIERHALGACELWGLAKPVTEILKMRELLK